MLANAYDAWILQPQADVVTALAIELQAIGDPGGAERGSQLEKCNALQGVPQNACVARAMTRAILM